MKKLFVSVPMSGRTESEIKASIAKMKKIAEVYAGEELELIDTYFPDIPDGVKNASAWCLGKSIQRLSEADIFIGIFQAWDWRGCNIENNVADAYGIKAYHVMPEAVIDNYSELMSQRVDEFISALPNDRGG